jgi:hypothetical protein
MALKTRVVSFVWGFSEATFFFFVPDIWLKRTNFCCILDRQGAATRQTFHTNPSRTSTPEDELFKVIHLLIS